MVRASDLLALAVGLGGGTCAGEVFKSGFGNCRTRPVVTSYEDVENILEILPHLLTSFATRQMDVVPHHPPMASKEVCVTDGSFHVRHTLVLTIFQLCTILSA